jgi:hypothetical protein
MVLLAFVGVLHGCSNGGQPAAPVAGMAPAADSGEATGAAGSLADITTDCGEPSDNLPTDVFCIGLYKGRDPTRYQPDAHPYKPGITFWSDGAEKQRYLYLPPGATIDSSNFDLWNFPIGTKAFKEFRFEGKLVETRIFWKRADKTWAAGTYIWDGDGADATLNTSRQPVIIASGYEIPTAKDCGKCHHGGADYLLGVEAVSLALPTSEGLNLAQLVAIGALTSAPVSTSITLPEDATGKAGAALGYLHANCGMPCHSMRGLGEETQLIMRLRADEFWKELQSPPQIPAVDATDTFKATLGQKPRTASVAQQFPGAVRIRPGVHDQSLVWLLSHRRGDYQMPPLVSHVIDETGTAQLSEWIDALPADTQGR